MQINNKLANFSPLVFLASLGAGGVAVMPFVLMQYTVEHGKGLISRVQLWAESMSSFVSLYYLSLEAIMVIFTVLHIGLTVYFLSKFIPWLRSEEAGRLFADPLKNTAF